jgi:hypothetical protein
MDEKIKITPDGLGINCLVFLPLREEVFEEVLTIRWKNIPKEDKNGS